MTELYKDRFPCHPTFQIDLSQNKTIDWTLKMVPPESIYWKTGKIKKKEIRILSKVTPSERKEFSLKEDKYKLQLLQRDLQEKANG